MFIEHVTHVKIKALRFLYDFGIHSFEAPMQGIIPARGRALLN
jgi:hypothetical protein